jgi:hypothetical protein
MISAVEARTVETTTEVAIIPRPVCTGLLRKAQDFHAADLKAFGLLLGDPADPLFPFSLDPWMGVGVLGGSER